MFQVSSDYAPSDSFGKHKILNYNFIIYFICVVSRNTQKLGGVVLLAGFGHGLAST
jgi:hypothetical protein